jgi:hypothetical protein
MVDVVRNMWSFQEGFGATTSLMDTMIRMFGIDI